MSEKNENKENKDNYKRCSQFVMGLFYFQPATYNTLLSIQDSPGNSTYFHLLFYV